MSDPRPKLVIIGNGMAATRLLDELLTIAGSADAIPYEVTVLGEEDAPGYNRILLSPWLADEINEDAVITHRFDWYKTNGLVLRTGDRVERVSLEQRCVHTVSGLQLAWDKLVFATGSRALRLPIPGVELEGVMCLRTLNEARRLKISAAGRGKAIVIGGGLLGLEAACGLLASGMKVSVVHNGEWLMNRQLDQEAGKFLANALHKRGLEIHVNANSEAFVAADSNKGSGCKTVAALQMADGRHLPCDVAVMALGITPEVTLAKEAGIVCRRGIAVDNYLRSSAADVYALGECSQIGNEMFGLVAPIWQQASVLAKRLCRINCEAWQSEVLPTRLKVSGIEVFSAGDLENVEACESLIWRDTNAGHYRRFWLRNGRLQAVVMVGSAEQGNECFDLIQQQIRIDDPVSLMLGQLPQLRTQLPEVA